MYKTLKHHLNEFVKTLSQLLGEGDGSSKIALAVSGGADSMCMVFLAQQMSLHFICLIVDHGLRKESQAEAVRTARFLQSKGIEVEILVWQQYQSSVQISNVQHQAREARYKLLAEYCRRHNISSLLTAHNKNDVAETVLMRIERGSGIDGISGIPSKQMFYDVAILRPMLGFARADILDLLSSADWEWIEDPSNKNLAFTRSRIRKLLNEQKNAEVWINRLSLLATNASRCRDFLERETQMHINAVCSISNYGYITLDRPSFAELHEEIQLRILSCILKAIGGEDYICKLIKLEALVANIISATKSCALMKCEIIQRHNTNKVLFIRERSKIQSVALVETPKSFIWDGRFIIEVVGEVDPAESFYISAMDAETWNTVKAQYSSAQPYKIMLTTPVLFHGQKFLASLVMEQYQDPSSGLQINAKAILQNKMCYKS